MEQYHTDTCYHLLCTQNQVIKEEAAVVHMDSEEGRRRLAAVAWPQIRRLLERRRSMTGPASATAFAQEPRVGIAHQMGSTRGRVSTHLKSSQVASEMGLEWLWVSAA